MSNFSLPTSNTSQQQFLFGILILLVDHSTKLLFSKLIMQYILYCLIAHLCN